MAGHVVDSDDHSIVGKVGRVTGGIGPGRTGEVMIPVRGGTEAFLAHAAEVGEAMGPLRSSLAPSSAVPVAQNGRAETAPEEPPAPERIRRTGAPG